MNQDIDMKKRQFLSIGAAFVGLTALSRYLPFQSDEKANEKTAQPVADASTAEGTFEVTKTEDEWREILSPAAFNVLRREGTEAPFSSPLNNVKTAGTFSCAGCDQSLFTSETKYNSGTGWPSFYAPIEGSVGLSVDRSFLMTRTEVHCDRCGGHLGHVFDDGPQPTGKRYCMNGVAMNFTPAQA